MLGWNLVSPQGISPEWESGAPLPLRRQWLMVHKMLSHQAPNLKLREKGTGQGSKEIKHLKLCSGKNFGCDSWHMELDGSKEI